MTVAVEKELDLGVPRAEILSGVERLLRRLGVDGTPTPDGEVTRFHGPGDVTIEVGPMPEERIRYPILFPRTLMVLRGAPEALEKIHLAILHAFLRPTG